MRAVVGSCRSMDKDTHAIVTVLWWPGEANRNTCFEVCHAKELKEHEEPYPRHADTNLMYPWTHLSQHLRYSVKQQHLRFQYRRTCMVYAPLATCRYGTEPAEGTNWKGAVLVVAELALMSYRARRKATQGPSAQDREPWASATYASSSLEAW